MDTVRPDLIYIFNLRFLPASFLVELDTYDTPLVIYVSDPWLEHWRESDEWLRWTDISQDRGSIRKSGALVLRWLARSLSKIMPRYDGDVDLTAVEFPSEFMKSAALNAGESVEEALVIPWGVRPGLAGDNPRVRDENQLSLLFVGRIEPAKGLHTLVQAVARQPSWALTVIGALNNDHYGKHLRKLEMSLDLSERIIWKGRLDRTAVLAEYAKHDALVLPSEWDEPFSITLLEGMAAGVPVVASRRGGTPEIVRHCENGLLFDDGNVDDLERAIGRLSDEGFAARLGEAGRETILSGYTIEEMVLKINDHLEATREAFFRRGDRNR